MVTDYNLSTILSELLDAIATNAPVLITSIDDNKIIGLLPKLLEHKLESIALLSMNETSGVRQFYLDTYVKQFSVIQEKLGGGLSDLDCIFLQGFPRCLEYSEFYTPGMRSDIDIFIPASAVDRFKEIAISAGFNYYGFDNEKIFIISYEQSEMLTANNWANKDVTMTYLQEVTIPKDLPIEIVDCYLPYVLRSGKTYLFVSLEVHHFYTDSRDIDILESSREPWPPMGVDRCGIEATLYFNLIRIYNGIHANEKRMRLILDTACLLSDKNKPWNVNLFKKILASSSSKAALMSLCVALRTIHPVFNDLICFDTAHTDSAETRRWLIKFYNSLDLGLNNE